MTATKDAKSDSLEVVSTAGMKSSVVLPTFNRSREYVSGNLVVQSAEVEAEREVLVQSSDHGVFLLTDSFNREMVVVPKGVRTPANESAYMLKSMSQIDSVDAIGPSTKLKWTIHPGSDYTTSPSSIRESWHDTVRFVRDDPDTGRVGLRVPQLGALHAIASHWTVSDTPATIVMPTGTGKTETMLATLLYCGCPSVLVIVPTDALRTQIFRKFVTLGCLVDIGVVPQSTLLPRVGMVRKGLKTTADAKRLANATNVLVATVAVLSASEEEAVQELAGHCSHLFIDEAHHIAARTWRRVRDLFQGKPVLQFTATPYRKDEKQVEGKIIYNYPLGKAQHEGYFKPIDLITVDELEDSRADTAIAKRALARLDEDISEGYDHIILARARSIPRAKEILEIYRRMTNGHNPVAIHSGSSLSELKASAGAIADGKSRVLVCVDMFGEGFDLPKLKIAAMHDIHKSLPITLQFVGRFVRTADSVGDASVVVNLADPQVDTELQVLYAEDPDWNALLRRSSEDRIAREISLQHFVESFTGDLPEQLPLWNLRPGFSTIVYKTNVLSWHPHALKNGLPKNVDAWLAVSVNERIAIAVIAKQEDVRWGRYQNIKDRYWNLVVAHWAKSEGLLFVYASDYNVIKTREIANAVCGSDATLVNGPQVFRVFSGIQLPMVKNLGASRAGMISFTMYFGPEVSAGLSQVEKAEADLNNIFGWGYENGERVTQGCSARRGKLWAATGGPVKDWRAWCETVGGKVVDDTIEEAEVTKGFLRPVEITERPKRVPLSAEWGERIVRGNEDRIRVIVDDREFRLYEIDLRIDERTESGPIVICVHAADIEAKYNLQIGNDGHGHGTFAYQQVGPHRVDIQMGNGNRTPLSDWCESDPVVINYADGCFSYNSFFVEIPCEATFDAELLVTDAWRDVDIRVESEGKGRRTDSIQHHVIEELANEFDIVFNDDAAGEAADVIALRREAPDKLRLRLVHCKYASSETPRAQVSDLYELCGQAQKCVKWKHKGLSALVQHMKRREKLWQVEGYTRFVKGAFSDLRALERASRYSKLLFEVTIVQPGLAKSRITDPILRLLGSTELYLTKSAEAPLLVICSQ